MIKSLRLKGFRRYVDERFELASGLCCIDGENNAGKTSLFLGVEYALFGVAGAIRSPIALLHPGATGVGVELVFVGKDGREYVLQRAHIKPPKARTKLTGHFTLKDSDGKYLLASDFQDHEDALALKLQELTGISRRVFDVAVHIRQGEIASILDGDTRLDIALGITAAVCANEELRAMALEDENAAESLESLQSSLAHVEKERASLAKDDAGAKKAVAALEAKLETAQKKLEALGEDTDGDDYDHDAVDDDIEDSKALQAASADRGDIAGRIARREAVLKSGEATCEHCGSTLDLAKAKAELVTWKARLADVDATIAKERAAKEKLVEAVGAKRVERDRARLERMKQRARAEADIDAANNALDESRAALEGKAERLAGAERELARLGVEVEAVGLRATRATKLRALASAFKDLQEKLREQAASELAASTLRIHRALSAADPSDDGGGGGEIEALTIDPVRYQVIVKSHDANAEMPASAAQGGGHKLLLGLAFRLALVERLGPFPFCLLDEPTYGLDAKRRTALLERIAGLKLTSQILLITHHAMGDVDGAQRIHIEREKHRSVQRKAS